MALSHEELVQGLEIYDIEAFRNELCPKGGIRISWSGSIGFGQYDLIVGDDGKLYGYSESMERTDDKYFSKELLRLLHEKIEVVD